MWIVWYYLFKLKLNIIKPLTKFYFCHFSKFISLNLFDRRFFVSSCCLSFKQYFSTCTLLLSTFTLIFLPGGYWLGKRIYKSVNQLPYPILNKLTLGGGPTKKLKEYYLKNQTSPVKICGFVLALLGCRARSIDQRYTYPWGYTRSE
jgi:hypothetical protein